jgi:hypothetical protein
MMRDVSSTFFHALMETMERGFIWGCWNTDEADFLGFHFFEKKERVQKSQLRIDGFENSINSQQPTANSQQPTANSLPPCSKIFILFGTSKLLHYLRTREKTWAPFLWAQRAMGRLSRQDCESAVMTNGVP